jgi:16S rRNA (guanine527-N7)-methyltransferase
MYERLEAGLAAMHIFLPSEVLGREVVFLSELLRWNRQINLTSIRRPEEAIEKHLIDSLSLLRMLPNSAWVIDMGSGPGLPGIPLAIARPELNVVTVDSVGKKISFQKHIKRQMGLNNLFPRHSRLESLTPASLPHPIFDIALARAVTSLDSLLKFSAPLLGSGGELIAQKGPEGIKELRLIENILPEYGFRLDGTETLTLPFSRAERQYLRFTRVLNSKTDE